MKILHLSDTPLSASPHRICKLFRNHTDHEHRHIVYRIKGRNRTYPHDILGSHLTRDEFAHWLDWADIIHYHNRWKRQEIFRVHQFHPPNKPGVIQIHSPRSSEDFNEEVNSGLPIAVIAQYHVREWANELRFVVPNVVDINSNLMVPMNRYNDVVTVSFAPSTTVGTGLDDKGYAWTNPILKRMKLAHTIRYKLIHGMDWDKAMMMKNTSDVGIDEMVTGGYHLSSLEYLSMGIATFANLDEHTEKVVKDLTGAEELPWILANRSTFKGTLQSLIQSKEYKEIGKTSRSWMEAYWNPDFLLAQYADMYEAL